MKSTKLTVPLLHFHQVSKTYPGETHPALQQVTLTLKEGEWVGLMGANGSGKSTLLKLALGFLLPDTGQITLMGNANLERARQFMGYIPENPQGLDHFTPSELLRYAGQMHHLPTKEIQHRTRELLEQLHLWEHRNALLAGFSRGMRQRVWIALALLHRPSILLLDEPFQGLDAESRNFLFEFLKNRPARGGILATHQLQMIQDICNVGIILHRGKIRAQLPLQPESLFYYEVYSTPALASVKEHLPVTLLDAGNKPGNQYYIRFQGSGDDLQKVLNQLKHHHLPIIRVVSGNRLEELYRQYVQHQ